jgi:Tol biopolymer transport system component
MVLVGTTLVFDTGPVDAAFPGRNGRLFCSTNRDGNTEVYSFNPDGSDPRRLTFHEAADFEATPSPDGTRVAFTSTRAGRGDQEIFIMYQDGSGIRRLTFTTGEDRPGTFSPDGTRIAFQSARFPVDSGPGHSALEIFVMDADGGNQTRLTNNTFQDSFAHWSPDGSRIAFTTNRDSFVDGMGNFVANFEIYTLVPVDADNDGNADVQSRVTNSPGEDAHAHWSPDGKQLTFHSRRDFATPNAFQIEIYRANAKTGGNAVRLTGPDEIFEAFPTWSPDGQKIAWSRFFPSDIFTMNASNGSAKTNITNTESDESRCDWGRLLPCTITGSGFIVGTEGDDVICGSDGQDYIQALGGNDVVYAGAGNDWVVGGPGNDIVFGGHGNDNIQGGDGNDTLFGDQGFDNLSGGNGDDIVSGSEDNDQVAGDAGTDECYGEIVNTCEVAAPPI